MMMTAIAISPMMRNILSVATILPTAVKASDMARIAPTIVPMIRRMSPVCARGLWQATVVPAAPVRGRGLVGRLACVAGTAPGHMVSLVPGLCGRGLGVGWHADHWLGSGANRLLW